MHTAKVVMPEMQSNGMAVILNLFAESIGEARKAANAHAHGQGLPLNIRGADMLRVGVALTVAVRHPIQVAGLYRSL